MHEYPLTQQIIRTAEQHALGRRVTRIDLVVGEDSGLVADCIQLYFDLIAEGTPCAGAELTIERVKPMLRCEACGRLFERAPFSFACTYEGCAGEGFPTQIGREFEIRSIEVEDEAIGEAHRDRDQAVDTRAE